MSTKGCARESFHGPCIFGLSSFSGFSKICPGFGPGFRSLFTIRTMAVYYPSALKPRTDLFPLLEVHMYILKKFNTFLICPCIWSVCVFKILQLRRQVSLNNWQIQSIFEHPHARVHDKMRISHFWSYLSHMWMDFASIWVILKLVNIVISTRTERTEKPEVRKLGFWPRKSARGLEARTGLWKQ